MLDRIEFLHARLMFTILFVLIGLAIWGVIAFLRGAAPSSLYRSCLWIAELLLGAEFALGVVLLANGLMPADLPLHLVYGVVAIGVIPAAMIATREQLDRRANLIYALACLFLLPIVLRALETARG